MAEKLKLKHVCPECKVNKWIVDYKEGCSSDLTRHSICLFCQQGKEIEKLRKENKELKSKIQEIYSLIADMQKANKVLNDELVDNGKDIHEIRNQLATAKLPNNPRTVAGEGKENSSRNREEQFIKATGRRVTTRRAKEQPRNETATRNRFSLLSEKEEETVLIGDSMVKDQSKHFGFRNINKRKVRSYPGANAKKLEEEVRKMKMENNKTTVIVQASGNDLFLRNGNAGQTEPLITQLEKTIKTVQSKTNKAIVIGILPRLNVSHYALSKAIGINDRLKSICEQNAVRFINLWDTFYGNRKLYKNDGIHFSEEGMRMFGSQLNLELYYTLRNPIDTEQPQRPENTLKTNRGNMVDNANRVQQTVTQGNE